MTHTSEEVARITEGLSERDQSLLLGAGCVEECYGEMWTVNVPDDERLAPAAVLSELGLAVRDHLMKGKSDGA